MNDHTRHENGREFSPADRPAKNTNRADGDRSWVADYLAKNPHLGNFAKPVPIKPAKPPQQAKAKPRKTDESHPPEIVQHMPPLLRPTPPERQPDGDLLLNRYRFFSVKVKAKQIGLTYDMAWAFIRYIDATRLRLENNIPTFLAHFCERDYLQHEDLVDGYLEDSPIHELGIDSLLEYCSLGDGNLGQFFDLIKECVFRDCVRGQQLLTDETYPSTGTLEGDERGTFRAAFSNVIKRSDAAARGAALKLQWAQPPGWKKRTVKSNNNDPKKPVPRLVFKNAK